MFIILLISSALGACKDIKVEKDCWADNNCRWYDDEDEPTCGSTHCDGAPMKGWCESNGGCQWKDGKCTSIDCRRYPADKCPTKDKDCKIFTDENDYRYCFPKSSDPKKTDECTQSLTFYACMERFGCAWDDGKCKYDGCSREEGTAAKCKDSAGCRILKATEEEEEDECVPKSYDPKNPYCGRFSEGTECNSVPDCMTVSGKCKEDECLSVETTQEECVKKTGCTWGTPELLKDWLDGKKACFNKDHEFEAGALGVIPALVQNKIFLLASALLLFLLI